MHLRESQHHVDDQRIAEEAHDAHDGVENLVDQRNDRQIGLAVLDRRVLLARYQRVIDARGAHHGRARYRAVHLDRRFIDTVLPRKKISPLYKFSRDLRSNLRDLRGDQSLREDGSRKNPRLLRRVGSVFTG